MYYVRQLFNGTVLVHVITPDSKQIRSWTAPFSAARLTRFVMAAGPNDTLYFQTDYFYYWEDEQPRPLYVLSGDVVLQSTLNLNLSIDTCARVFAMAVSRRSGHIALACDSGIQLFRSSGAVVPTFSYATVLPDYAYFISLVFDSIDRLLAVASYGDYGIQVVSSVNGDLLSDWSNRVPPLDYANGHFHPATTRRG